MGSLRLAAHSTITGPVGDPAISRHGVKVEVSVHVALGQCDQKNRQMSIKDAQNDLTREIKDFDTYTKIA